MEIKGLSPKMVYLNAWCLSAKACPSPFPPNESIPFIVCIYFPCSILMGEGPPAPAYVSDPAVESPLGAGTHAL